MADAGASARYSSTRRDFVCKLKSIPAVKLPKSGLDCFNDSIFGKFCRFLILN
jgi:hypothetical protein